MRFENKEKGSKLRKVRVHTTKKYIIDAVGMTLRAIFWFVCVHATAGAEHSFGLCTICCSLPRSICFFIHFSSSLVWIY